MPQRGVFDQTRDLFGQFFGLGLHWVSFVKLKFKLHIGNGLF